MTREFRFAVALVAMNAAGLLVARSFGSDELEVLFTVGVVAYSVLALSHRPGRRKGTA